MNRPAVALLSLLLCAPAWAATALDVRMSILNDCVARGKAARDDPAKAARFCTCSTDVMERALTLYELGEMERYLAEKRDVNGLPQVQRISQRIQACRLK
jgi:hypothetical protein